MSNSAKEWMEMDSAKRCTHLFVCLFHSPLGRVSCMPAVSLSMCSCVHVCAWCGGGVAVVWRSKKAFITLCSPVVPLLSTSKADSGLASEFRWDRAIYTAYERMLKAHATSKTYKSNTIARARREHLAAAHDSRHCQQGKHTHHHTLQPAFDTSMQVCIA